MADRPETTERSAEEIRRDIERTRSHMDRTVEALGDKLSLGRIVDDLYERLRSDGGAGLGEAIRSHPLPYTVMGLGLGWLAWEQARGDGNGHPDAGTYGRAEGRVGPYRGDAVDRDDPDWEYASKAAKVKAKVAGAAHAVADAAQAAAGKAESVREKMQETAEGAGFFSLLERNPMALGAIAFGLGLASGIGAPTTSWEDERVGPVADRLKDEMRRTAEEAAERVEGIAREAYGAARDELERQREEFADPVKVAADRLKASAKQVVSAAADAARRRARETAEG